MAITWNQPVQPVATKSGGGIKWNNPPPTPPAGQTAFGASQGALGHSQSLMDSVGGFYNDIKTGIAKNAGSQLMSAGAQHAGPIGAGMAAAAPEWNKYMQEGEAAMQPQGVGQQIGNVEGNVAPILMGGEGIVNGIKSIPAMVDAVRAKGVVGLAKEGFEGAKNIINSFAENRADKAALETSQRAIIPKMTSTEAGNYTMVNPTRGAAYPDMSADKAHMEAADAVKHIVKGVDKNADKIAVEDRIAHVAENEAKPLLAQKTPLNFEDIRGKMMLNEPPTNFKQPGEPNKAAMTSWDNTREVMLNHLADYMTKAATKEGDFGAQTDTNHLWDGIKSATDKAERELKMDFGTSEYAGKKAAIEAFRRDGMQILGDSIRFPGQMDLLNKAEEFVQHARGSGIQLSTPEQRTAFIKQMGLRSTPESEKTAADFEGKISQLKNLYKAKDNLSTWMGQYLQENQSWAQKNPIKASALKGGAAVGVGLTGAGVVGAEAKKMLGL